MAPSSAGRIGVRRSHFAGSECHNNFSCVAERAPRPLAPGLAFRQIVNSRAPCLRRERREASIGRLTECYSPESIRTESFDEPSGR